VEIENDYVEIDLEVKIDLEGVFCWFVFEIEVSEKEFQVMMKLSFVEVDVACKEETELIDKLNETLSFCCIIHD